MKCFKNIAKINSIFLANLNQNPSVPTLNHQELQPGPNIRNSAKMSILVKMSISVY